VALGRGPADRCGAGRRCRVGLRGEKEQARLWTGGRDGPPGYTSEEGEDKGRPVGQTTRERPFLSLTGAAGQTGVAPRTHAPTLFPPRPCKKGRVLKRCPLFARAELTSQRELATAPRTPPGRPVLAGRADRRPVSARNRGVRRTRRGLHAGRGGADRSLYVRPVVGDAAGAGGRGCQWAQGAADGIEAPLWTPGRWGEGIRRSHWGALPNTEVSFVSGNGTCRPAVDAHGGRCEVRAGGRVPQRTLVPYLLLVAQRKRRR